MKYVSIRGHLSEIGLMGIGRGGTIVSDEGYRRKYHVNDNVIRVRWKPVLRHLVLDTNILRNEGTNKYFHVGTGSPLITRSTREMSCPLIPQNILKEASIVSLISF